MPELKDFVHWIPTPFLALGFWLLLKRTFRDFEDKIGTLFNKLEKSLEKSQDHETRITVLEDRVMKKRNAR